MGFLVLPALLTAVDTDQIVDGAITFPKLGDVEKWELIQTLTPSGVSTITTAALSAKSQYMFKIKSLLMSADDNLLMRLNGETGNIYFGIRLNDGAVETYASQSALNVIYCNSLTNMTAMGIITGLSAAIANGRFSVSFQGVSGYTGAGSRYNGITGMMTSGNATPLTDITFFAGNNFTGIIEVYAR